MAAFEFLEDAVVALLDGFQFAVFLLPSQEILLIGSSDHQTQLFLRVFTRQAQVRISALIVHQRRKSAATFGLLFNLLDI